MRLGFIFFLGVFVNLLLASIFPTVLLPADTANSLIGTDTYLYNVEGSPFGSNQKTSTSGLVTTLQDESSSTELLQTNQQESNFIESISFFDGLFDSLAKAGKYLSLIIPFASVLFLLPGALGLILGGLYSAVLFYAIIRFIRGA
jgi:hypothetical protein